MMRSNPYWLRRFGATAVLVGIVGVVLWVGVYLAPTAPPVTGVAPTVYPTDGYGYETGYVAGSPDPAATPSTAVFVYPETLCAEWVRYAHGLGWHYDNLDELGYIMWRESRCDPTQHNTTLNADGSSDIGLTQINDRSWCLPTRWYPSGYLQTLGVVSECRDLFNPTLHIVSALVIHNYSVSENGNGWAPWALPKDFCNRVVDCRNP
ncbi:MAG: lysozyme [Podoviridae sp. ctDWo9]|nr:MAG: lysozyme [Podoviridae sp. ctDWo9]